METILRMDALRFLTDLPDVSVDMVISSPPYFMGKEYDTSNSVADFLAAHKSILEQLVRVLKSGGSVCWQVGNHVKNNVLVPLDALVYEVFSASPSLILRNRIIWTFGHGAHCNRRLSGRHETVLWFTKGDNYYFDLNSIRVPQKYPGKKHYKGDKRGQPSGNPLGKNPGDVWDIPNVKASHVEKTGHPCQFPVALAQRFVRALCPQDGLVIDPYLGSGSAGVASLLEGRRFAGCDLDPRYVAIALSRIDDLKWGRLKIRPIDQPIYAPRENEGVAKVPDEWLTSRSNNTFVITR
jgi:adenine-specific DNA-methyltransferase